MNIRAKVKNRAFIAVLVAAMGVSSVTSLSFFGTDNTPRAEIRGNGTEKSNHMSAEQAIREGKEQLYYGPQSRKLADKKIAEAQNLIDSGVKSKTGFDSQKSAITVQQGVVGKDEDIVEEDLKNVLDLLDRQSKIDTELMEKEKLVPGAEEAVKKAKTNYEVAVRYYESIGGKWEDEMAAIEEFERLLEGLVDHENGDADKVDEANLLPENKIDNFPTGDFIDFYSSDENGNMVNEVSKKLEATGAADYAKPCENEGTDIITGVSQTPGTVNKQQTNPDGTPMIDAGGNPVMEEIEIPETYVGPDGQGVTQQPDGSYKDASGNIFNSNQVQRAMKGDGFTYNNHYDGESYQSDESTDSKMSYNKYLSSVYESGEISPSGGTSPITHEFSKDCIGKHPNEEEMTDAQEKYKEKAKKYVELLRNKALPVFERYRDSISEWIRETENKISDYDELNDEFMKEYSFLSGTASMEQKIALQNFYGSASTDIAKLLYASSKIVPKPDINDPKAEPDPQVIEANQIKWLEDVAEYAEAQLNKSSTADSDDVNAVNDELRKLVNTVNNGINGFQDKNECINNAKAILNTLFYSLGGKTADKYLDVLEDEVFRTGVGSPEISNLILDAYDTGISYANWLDEVQSWAAKAKKGIESAQSRNLYDAQDFNNAQLLKRCNDIINATNSNADKENIVALLREASSYIKNTDSEKNTEDWNAWIKSLSEKDKLSELVNALDEQDESVRKAALQQLLLSKSSGGIWKLYKSSKDSVLSLANKIENIADSMCEAIQYEIDNAENYPLTLHSFAISEEKSRTETIGPTIADNVKTTTDPVTGETIADTDGDGKFDRTKDTSFFPATKTTYYRTILLHRFYPNGPFDAIALVNAVYFYANEYASQVDSIANNVNNTIPSIVENAKEKREADLKAAHANTEKGRSDLKEFRNKYGSYGDNKPDQFDVTGDGKPDSDLHSLGVDTNKDGKVDYWDTPKGRIWTFSGDEKPEAWDTNGDGKPDVWDNDGDGIADRMDSDGDGNADKYIDSPAVEVIQEGKGKGNIKSWDNNNDGIPDAWDSKAETLVSKYHRASKEEIEVAEKAIHTTYTEYKKKEDELKKLQEEIAKLTEELDKYKAMTAEAIDKLHIDTNTLKKDIDILNKMRINLKDIFKVYFSANGHGTAPADPIRVEDGQTIKEPAALTADGYTFGGWCTDKNGVNAFDFSTPVTSDMLLYAKWTDNSGKVVPANPAICTVYFSNNHGIAPAPQKVENGKTATKPEDPTAIGYHFNGWKLNGSIYDFATPVTSDILLKADFSESSDTDIPPYKPDPTDSGKPGSSDTDNPKHNDPDDPDKGNPGSSDTDDPRKRGIGDDMPTPGDNSDTDNPHKGGGTNGGNSSYWDTDNPRKPYSPTTDTDGDWKPDTWNTRGGDGGGRTDMTDRNRNGAPDAWDNRGDGKIHAVDDDGNNAPDKWDTTGDGNTNAWDTNSDNTPDAWNRGTGKDPDAWDTNHDGVPDTWDSNEDGDPDIWDKNGDGIPDAWDTNHDGNPDLFDTDGDGIADMKDTDGDGKPDTPYTPKGFDTNGDGKDDAWDNDGDGKPDAFDTDGDGKADAWDTNHDGKPDVWDTDHDGKADKWDMDGDGNPDMWDSDGDGKPDKWDMNGDGNPDMWDTDHNGRIDTWDMNGDGKADMWDKNGDGNPDAWDTNSDGNPDMWDSDHDGKVDTWDLNYDGKADMWDTDKDGKPDAFDNNGDGKPDTFDTNNDGKIDAWDTNGDGKPDTFDTDGDGIIDAWDTDGDGKPDAFDTNKDGIIDAWDTDGDGKPDIFDTDGDGIPDMKDTDKDGKPDTAYTPNGYDTDGDGKIDAWDFDGDGVIDGWDTNGDGKIDAWDTDNDGKPDAFDTNGDGKIDAWDTDKDGKPDMWDLDGDGRPDAWDTDHDGKIDAWDANGDGRADAWDTDHDGKADTWDTNGDGIPDAWDTDGDGKPDKYWGYTLQTELDSDADAIIAVSRFDEKPHRSTVSGTYGDALDGLIEGASVNVTGNTAEEVTVIKAVSGKEDEVLNAVLQHIEAMKAKFADNPTELAKLNNAVVVKNASGKIFVVVTKSGASLTKDIAEAMKTNDDIRKQIADVKARLAIAQADTSLYKEQANDAIKWYVAVFNEKKQNREDINNVLKNNRMYQIDMADVKAKYDTATAGINDMNASIAAIRADIEKAKAQHKDLLTTRSSNLPALITWINNVDEASAELKSYNALNDRYEKNIKKLTK